MTSISKPAGQAFFDRIPANDDDAAEKCKALYDEWAKTYDNDLTDSSQGYMGPVNAAKAIANAGGFDNDQAVVLDAGCGTGLSGIAVRDAGGSKVTIDGIDISTGMLDIAKTTGIYRRLNPANLAEPLEIVTGAYDIVVCVGTLTGGHVGPIPALKEFKRVVRPGGLVVATVKEAVWSTMGYKAEAERLRDESEVEIVSTESAPYRQGQGVNAIMLVMRKLR